MTRRIIVLILASVLLVAYIPSRSKYHGRDVVDPYPPPETVVVNPYPGPEATATPKVKPEKDKQVPTKVVVKPTNAPTQPPPD